MSPTHAAINVVWRYRFWVFGWLFGLVEFLVIDYQWLRPGSDELSAPDVRFPTGTNRRYPSETVEVTRDRVIDNETGLICAGQTEMLGEPVERDFEHVQHGFLVSYRRCRGALRRTGGQDLDGDHISDPYWVSARKLKSLISPKHRRWFDRACQELGVRFD